jgi:hypothetical protein
LRRVMPEPASALSTLADSLISTLRPLASAAARVRRPCCPPWHTYGDGERVLGADRCELLAGYRAASIGWANAMS